MLELVQSGAAFAAGSALSKTPVQIGSGFSTVFQFRITQPAGITDGTEPGADGFTFALESQAITSVATGIGLGYAGIQASDAVKFDTFQNTDQGDPSSNYLGVASNGDINNADFPGGQLTVTPNFDNGTVWTAWLDYDGTTLSAYLLDSADASIKPLTPSLSYKLNIPADVQGQTAFVGFTAAVGAASENVDILNWAFTSNAAPEPGALALLAAGSMVMVRRRR